MGPQVQLGIGPLFQRRTQISQISQISLTTRMVRRGARPSRDGPDFEGTTREARASRGRSPQRRSRPVREAKTGATNTPGLRCNLSNLRNLCSPLDRGLISASGVRAIALSQAAGYGARTQRASRAPPRILSPAARAHTTEQHRARQPHGGDVPGPVWNEDEYRPLAFGGCA